MPPTQNGGFTPSPGAVQLGDNSPRNAPLQSEVTDVLPTARYMPNARPSSRSGPVMTGQSNPPPDDYNTLSTRNAQYNAQAQQVNDSVGQQHPQPGVAP